MQDKGLYDQLAKHPTRQAGLICTSAEAEKFIRSAKATEGTTGRIGTRT